LNAIKYSINQQQRRNMTWKLDDFLFISTAEEVISKTSLGGSSIWLSLLRNRMRSYMRHDLWGYTDQVCPDYKIVTEVADVIVSERTCVKQ
jgi:hypothetical protein